MYSGDVLDKALEKLAQRRDPKAFGSEMGERVPSRQLPSPAPSEQSAKSNLIKVLQPFKSVEADVGVPSSRPRDRKVFLNELLTRKKIPLPGEQS
jgi:hypothetical protein